jgi:hypothetical protein
MGSRSDMNAPATAKLTHRARIDDAEVKTELGSQRVPPWDLPRGRADDKDFSGPVVNHEFAPSDVIDRLSKDRHHEGHEEHEDGIRRSI